MNAKLKDIVVMKSFKSGNASVGAKGTKEMTVSISVPNGYKFLAVSNLATNNEVCPSYFSWRDGMILSILVDTFISKISFPMQPGPEIGSISDA